MKAAGSSTLSTKLDCFQGWVKSSAFIHEDLLAQTNSRFQSRKNQKFIQSNPALTILQNQRIQNVHSKIDSTPSLLARDINPQSWMKNKNKCRKSDCVSIAYNLAIGQKIAQTEIAVCPILGDDPTNLAQWLLEEERGYNWCPGYYYCSSNKNNTKNTPCIAH